MAVYSHICFNVSKDCYNMLDSYGEICVGCNCCGRFDKDTMYQSRIATDKRYLEEAEQHLTDASFQTELQQKNIRLDIEYFTKRIAAAEVALAQEGAQP